MSDSWEGGVNGAKPGIIMPGDPARGDQYRQEYYPRHALDQARVAGERRARHRALRLLQAHTADRGDQPPAGPRRQERKYYVAGVGDIKEHTVSGNHEQIRLVSVTHTA